MMKFFHKLFYQLWEKKHYLSSDERERLFGYFSGSEKNKVKAQNYFKVIDTQNSPETNADYELDYVIDAFPFYIAIKFSEDKSKIAFASVFKEKAGESGLEYLSLQASHSLSTEIYEYESYFAKSKFVKISNSFGLMKLLITGF